jgi:hypothetical protein
MPELPFISKRLSPPPAILILPLWVLLSVTENAGIPIFSGTVEAKVVALTYPVVFAVGYAPPAG